LGEVEFGASLTDVLDTASVVNSIVDTTGLVVLEIVLSTVLSEVEIVLRIHMAKMLEHSLIKKVHHIYYYTTELKAEYAR
jgi:hypothetical protein